ncbi:MAG: iron-containing alcohol dehydrogenase family protein [Spirochaetes bacterium]|nr:iron-containing alcohol dehydrogenase family protein [Spirochaetota bacterium]
MEINVPTLVRVKPGAMMKIGKYLRMEKFKNIALFYGTGIKPLFGEKIDISLLSSEIHKIYESEESPHLINDIFDISLRIPSGTDAVVAVGGGRVIDVCKYIAFVNKLPMVSVPTAVSNDAFCASSSSLIVNGKRKTVKTVLPYGVIVDTFVLQNAPVAFLYSGMGDLFCKITSLFDWKLAYKNSGVEINDFAKVMTNNAVDAFIYYKDKDIKNLEFIRIIASSLMLSGIAMEIAGSSRPGSGSEHLISHAYDKVAEKPSAHGLQVGVSAYGVSFLQGDTYEQLKKVIAECGFFSYLKENPLSRRDLIEAVKFAPGIKENYYTILSESGSIEKLIDFIENDEMMQQMAV